MLPPTLKSLKEKLDSKSGRTIEEAQLLLELQDIDRSLKTSDFSESVINKAARLSGAGHGCPCCGR